MSTVSAYALIESVNIIRTIITAILIAFFIKTPLCSVIDETIIVPYNP